MSDQSFFDPSLSIPVVEQIPLQELDPDMRHRFWVNMVSDGLGMPVYIPVLVAKGEHPGPTVGITAAVHGNELNGIPVIQRLFRELENEELRGTIIGVPVMNVPGLLRKQRGFNDGTDLNRIMPGRPDGNRSQVYANRWIERLLFPCEYLFDLHTASFGRINSYYIRANMDDPEIAHLARLQNPQIIVHKKGPVNTLRHAMSSRGAQAITLEVGDPHRFQKGMIRSGLTGLYNALIHLNMLDGEIDPPENDPIICGRSFWIYTDSGGILSVHPGLGDRIEKGAVIATIQDVFGRPRETYRAPETGYLIGKSISPVAPTGSRILHLGIPA